MLEQCAQRVAKGRDALLPAYCTLCEVIHARANLNVVAELFARMNQFSQATTKMPPSFDGKTSWFAYEDAIDDWCDITELDDEKRGLALRNRLEGDGVTDFKRTLRPFFVKGSVNVFLYRFQQFMNLRRGSSDLMQWMSRFQIQLKRLEEAWGDTLTPINDPARDEVRQYTQSLSTEVRQAMTAAQILTAVNERRRQVQMEKVPPL